MDCCKYKVIFGAGQNYFMASSVVSLTCTFGNILERRLRCFQLVKEAPFCKI